MSAWVLYDGERVERHAIEMNEIIEARILGDRGEPWECVLEQITSYGMPVGAEVFETVFWTGRFYSAAKTLRRIPTRIPRGKVKLHICGSPGAKDSNIRQALIDRFGGKDRAIGKKASSGPLYGLRKDEWQALALAVTWWDQRATANAAGV